MAMTATSTRSTRRAEGPVQRATRHHNHLLAQQSNSSRPLKRLHEATNLTYDIKPVKKAKFEIEIPSKTQYQARFFKDHQHHNSNRSSRLTSLSATHNSSPKHDASSRQTTTAPPPLAPEPSPAPAPASAPAPAQTIARAAQKFAATAKDKDTSPAALTKHNQKVVNGIKHELDRLQPSSADMANSNTQGRKLRSQEGVRYKSELSAYFPEYDEVIGNVPKEHHILMLDTPIVILGPSPSPSSSLPRREPHSCPSTFPVRTYGNDLFTNLHDSQTVDLSWLESQYKGKTLTDPLPDSYYEPIHKKESRNEKITRNAEKGRSQHEKEQVIRLLDGLRGPDWLKTMGVSGITESKKKQFEPARAHFIDKCEVVLDKFRKWAAEEKRLKLEKERAAKESRASQEAPSSKADGDQDGVIDEEAADLSVEEQSVDGEHEHGEHVEVSSNHSESDVDASIKKQLLEEAMARSRMAAKSTRRRPVTATQAAPPTPVEFKSFFKKPYLRDAALNKSRRRGRTVMAWGEPVPEFEEQDFDLPEEFRDAELLKSRARRLRRVQRSTRNRD
ncbi:hypothetical protein N0V82_006891 [Gnomoniopsis sp. IMI 355080]|nr:hypothetical protein N0V82_006891 [Gnomoniopsis sp. IMI 355080]